MVILLITKSIIIKYQAITDMNIVSSDYRKAIVSLQQLVPQHDCLKLLILHTPYTLIIDSLSFCINLVKLDLSKNNLQTFPYIGDLRHLKIVFIHQNKLDVSCLKNMFQKNHKKSFLSENVVWVTFWGNKNAFFGRHYLANQTNALAIDKNLVVPQQRQSNCIDYSKIEPFAPQTDLTSYFTKKSLINRFSSQEEYMKELWLQMRQLRKKHQHLHPIIKIQKVFRGWIVRRKNKLNNQSFTINKSIKSSFFLSWKNYLLKTKKLKSILIKVRKQFLLEDRRQMIRKQIFYKIVQIARQVKRRIYYRKLSVKSEMRFYGIVLNNYLVLKNVYKQLDLERSSSLYIYKENWDDFSRYIIPFAACFSNHPVLPLKNQKYCLNHLYQYTTKTAKQTIKLLKVNRKSLLTQTKSNKITKKSLKGILFPTNLKAIYRGIHLSTYKSCQLKQMNERLQKKRQMQLNELIKIQGDFCLLKTIVRGIFFYNTKRITLTQIKNQRIFVFSQFKIKQIVSAVKIQKNWRGFILRKKNVQKFKQIIKMQRAAIIIQRWIRNMSNYQKSCFLDRNTKKISKIFQNSFYIQFSEYQKFISQQRYHSAHRIHFKQQNIILCINKLTQKLSISWNRASLDLHIHNQIKINKLPFTTQFIINKLQISSEDIYQHFLFQEEQQIQPCLLAYLFHYQTQTNLIIKNNKKYLQIICKSKKQVKFRLFILALLTYTIKNKEGILIKQNKLFKYQDINKKNINNFQGHFICNQNYQFIKNCQNKLANNKKISLYGVINKCYFQVLEQKPIKNQEKFFIYLNSQVQITSQVNNEVNIQKKQILEQRKRYKTQFSQQFKEFVQKQFLLTEHHQIQSACNAWSKQRVSIASKAKSLNKKKSVRRYKIEKKRLNKNDYPVFVLDSFSINDRLTTQPDRDRVASSASLYENNVNASNIIKIQKKVESKIKLQPTIKDDVYKKPSYSLKKTHYYKKKEDDYFIKKFVNLGNFIQNQYATQHRRRIKTEIQMSSIQAAQTVKKQHLKSQKLRIDDQQQKFKKIRESHNKHRQLVQKSKELTKDIQVKLKTDHVMQKQKRLRDKNKKRRLKISFAQQCFPLAIRTKKNDYFS